MDLEDDIRLAGDVDADPFGQAVRLAASRPEAQFRRVKSRSRLGRVAWPGLIFVELAAPGRSGRRRR